jgi:two-component system, NarL family, sensor kinase
MPLTKQVQLLFFSIVLFLPATLLAQQVNVDSLFRLFKQSSPQEVIDIYNQLANSYRTNNPDSSLYFAKLALDGAEKINYTKGKMLAMHSTGACLSVKGQFSLSQKYLEEGLEIAEKEKNDSVIALIHNGIGNNLFQLGKYAESLEHHFKALEIRERIKDIIGITTSKINIGLLYQTQDKLLLAEQYTREALDVARANNLDQSKIHALHTLANVYGMENKIKEAMALDEEGIAIAETTNNEFAKSMFYDNMANCYQYAEVPDFSKAMEFFSKSLAIDSSFGNKKQMSDTYINLGSLEMMQRKNEAAIPYLKRSIDLSYESGYAEGRKRAFELLADTYRHTGKQDLAFDALQQSVKIKDSLLNLASESKIAELQTIYETEKKQQKIVLQQEQLSKKNYIIYGIATLTLLAALLGFSYYNRYRLKQKTRLQQTIMQQQELATRAVLQAEEDERQRIAKDLHDGIGQMMSAAKMNLSAFESETEFSNKEKQQSFGKIITLVDESCKELRNVSHNMMPNALLKNNLAAAIKEFIDKLDSKKLQVHCYTEGIEERMDANMETVFYRIIQECVNNVIKHAEATTLDISILKDKDGIDATIEDNGKGFDATDKTKFEGIGLKNITTRVEYLKGTVDFDSSPGKGTLVAIHIPLT